MLAGLATAVSPAPAQKEPLRAAFTIGPVRQLGPAHPGRAVGLEVQVRNVGKTECAPCQIHLLGGGLAASQPLPRLAPGETGKVILGGLVFSKVGKYVLTLAVRAPKESVDFEGGRPHKTFELIVLEAPPLKRATPR